MNVKARAEQRMQTLNTAAELVWDFRREMGEAWPTPHQGDALRFAFTEAGEVLDAWLRWKGGYARNNNGKSMDVLDELSDVAMMLITALGPQYAYLAGPGNDIRNLDAICGEVGELFYLWCHGKAWRIRAEHALTYIANYFERRNGSLVAHLQKRLERIYNKVIGHASA